MPDLPTFDVLYRAGQAEAISREPRLTDWSEGSALDAVVGAGGVQADEALAVVVDRFAAQFVDLAEGDDLDALMADRFGLQRKPAVASIGVVTLQRGVAEGSFVVGPGLELSASVDGETVTFTTDETASFGVEDDQVDVAATCTATGRAGNVAAGAIDTVVSPPVADTSLGVSNNARFAGGAATESDEAFRARGRRYFRTLRKGTVGALEAGAKNVPGIEFATVDEATVAPADGGFVSVYIGDPEGAGNAPLAALVTVELDDWRCAGIEARVFEAVREEIAMAITLTVVRGANRSAIREAARAAVVAYAAGLDPGRSLRIARAESAAIRVSTQVLTAKVTSHAADIAPSAGNRALRVRDQDLTLSFVESS